jgi:hypothetical protein
MAKGLMRHLDEDVRVIDLRQQRLLQNARLALGHPLRHQHALQGEGTRL